MTRVVCMGLATQDSVFALPRYPAADDRVVADALVVAGGGPAATAAVTLARLGVETFFVGAVGGDAVGDAIRTGLEQEGVDVGELEQRFGARSPQSSILVTAEGRAIVHFSGTAAPLDPSRRALELMREASWVHVDHAGFAAAPRDVRLSVDGGNPIPALELAGVGLYAPTQAALERDFGSVEAALAAGAETVVVTRGHEGCSGHTATGSFDAPATALAEPVSTLGAGDVFHGALLAAFVHGSELPEALAFANDCAARSCQALDGRSAIPTLEEVRP